MKYPNLRDLAPYFPLAYFAHITPDLLQAVFKGDEDLTASEGLNICKYTNIPYSVAFCPKLITLDRNNYRHWRMLGDLHEKLITIWEWQKKGSHEADLYMEYQRDHYVNLDLDFRNRKSPSYCRYLGVKHEMDNALLFIRCEQDKIHRKPRGIRGGAAK